MTTRLFSRTILLVLAVTALSLAFTSAASAKERRVIIGFHQEPGASEDALVQRHSGKSKRRFKHAKAIAATVSDQAIQSLKGDPNVSYVEEDVPVYVVDPVFDGIEYDNSWGVTRIGSAFVHARDITGAGVKVAVLDTGIDYTHPELVDNYRGGARFIQDDLDPTNNDPFDDSWNGHGTHVAGVISAVANGIEVVGVAPQVSLYAVKVLNGAGAGYLSDLIAGIEWAVDQEMDIVNMSIGMRQDYQSLADACARAAEAGVLLVAAAGNTGYYSFGEVLYPALYDSVIAVGATNQDDTLNYVSAYGPDVELVAPGGAIYSTAPYGGFRFLTGTSQAAPHVAGVAALAMSAAVDDCGGTPEDVRHLLQETAIDLGDPGRDDRFGFGLVNAESALMTSMGGKQRKGKGRAYGHERGKGKRLAKGHCKDRGGKSHFAFSKR